jgi:hypothetical protein
MAPRIVRSSLVHIELLTVRDVAECHPQEETMKLKFALVGLAALGSLAAAGNAAAMPIAPLSPASNVERAAVACGPNGCIRTAPVYRGYGYGVRRYGYGVHRGYAYGRGYAYHRGYRRW